ncbi:uncharacterized protein LOC124148036 [Haliotis rufescens]|uniref:uncharacterized protein LOC124148036 n=1 Tax=Haliotis rufescens TaxID=6454 RepID=UPI00201EDE21|nr:uncharacterized protein LOC124148036 [Haliotis rufescens]
MAASGNNMMTDSYVQFLEEEFARNPLKASVTIQALGEAGADKDASPQSDACTGNEQTMKLAVGLPSNLTELLNMPNDKTQLILVADRSGSMSGNPWNQVKQALLDVITDSLDDSGLQVDVITYDTGAEYINYTRNNFKEVIGSLNSRGSTSFSAAFGKIDEVIAENSAKRFTKVVVIFLTDGQDGGAAAASRAWQTRLSALSVEVVIHTVGFSQSHDFKFLQFLSTIGSTDGIFRYCEPGDGPVALKAKIQELFEYISLSSGQTIDLDLEMEGDDKIVGLGSVVQTSTIQGQITQIETDGTTDGQLQVTAESWIYMKDPNSLPTMKIKMIKKFRKDKTIYTLNIAVVVDTIRREMVTTATEKVDWAMKILSRNTDILTTKLADKIETNGDVSKLQTRLSRLQERVTKTPMFGPGVTKEMREILMDHIKEIQQKIDMMHSMMARYLRGETQSVSMLARAHDLRYEAKFSKNRRQRLMDQRVSKNITKVKADQEKLKSLTVSAAEMDQLSQDATEFFFCVLSQCSVKDVLLNKDDVENAIGFGLAVRRPEHALDAPTATRIQVISGTMVSRESIFDALEYKISVEGHLNAHGGFDFSDPLGCATVGMGREPINAWLPLYITKSHWERVKVMLKPTLGYFCTLDPLGYDFKQMDILFMVLGSMIGQLSDTNAGQHQLRMLFAMQRTCAATVVDFDLLPQITTTVKNFITSPEGRTKDVIPNLCTLIGYLVAMPTSVSRPLFGYDQAKDDEMPEKACSFWFAFITECLRRAGGSLFHDISDAKLDGVIDHLVNPRATTSAVDDNARETTQARLVTQCRCLQDEDTGNIKLKMTEFDPTVGLERPAVELKHSVAVDKVMDVWGQAKCGAISNKSREEQVLTADKEVKRWLKEGKRQAGVDADSGPTPTDVEGATEAAEEDGFDVDNVDSTILEVTAKLLERLTRNSFPNLNSIPGFLAFLHHWLGQERDYVQMDKNGGLAPYIWVGGVKVAVSELYAKMNGFLQTCEAEVKQTETSDPNTLVVMATDEELMAAASTTIPEADVSTGEVTGVDDVKDADGNAAGNDSDGVNYVSDDSEDEHAPARRKRAIQRRVNLPMILHCVNTDINQVNMIRAMLCQAVAFHTNSRARAGAKEGQLKDLGCTGNADVTICDFHALLELRRKGALSSLRNKVLWERANYSMLHAQTVWAFVGYLISTYKDRDEGISLLVDSIVSCDSAASIPHLADKLRVILNGKWQDYMVYANGNCWLPEKKLTKKFEQVVGTEAWSEIDVDLRSNIQIHIYRESDIPNRHSHCNSNPYIPNVLRKKLGMPPLAETAARRSAYGRLRSKLT